MESLGTDFMPMDWKDLLWLRQCRTQIAEVAHIITFITNYIFSDTLELKRELDVSKATNWRGLGTRLLEMLLVYGFVFVSFDEQYREIRIWEPSELEIGWRKTPMGFFSFKARVRPPFGKPQVMVEEDQPRLLALVYQYPELGHPMSTLTYMRTHLEILNPTVLAGFVAALRGANPTTFVQTEASATLDVAGRDLWAQQEQERQIKTAEEAMHQREVAFINKTHSAQSMTNQAVVAALQVGTDSSEYVTMGEVAAKVMQGSVKVPWMVMPQNMTVGKGPEPHVDTKFIEMVHQRARQIIAESFGVPAAIFNVDSKYVTNSVAGISYHMMESAVDHFTTLILESIDCIVEFFFPHDSTKDEKPVKKDEKGKKPESGKRKLDFTSDNTHVLRIVRRKPLEQVLLLKTELERKAYIRMLAASTGMEEADFDPIDRELELQKAGVKDTEPQVVGKLGSAALGKLS